GHVHEKDRDVASRAVLIVKIGADRLRQQYTDQASLFPGFEQSGFPSSLAEVDAALGDHPALTAAGGHQAKLAGFDRNHGSLTDPGRTWGHERFLQGLRLPSRLSLGGGPRHV